MAANQSRRRTDLDSMPAAGSGPQNSTRFAYQPLDTDPEADSIRLVLIEPCINLDDPLSCKLIHVKFAEKPRFKALSYMWGNEAVQHKILLNGADFNVGQNLWDALHSFRREGDQMHFWMDAICINQLDIPERNRQLTMMKWIYSRADTVVIWLGKKYSKYQSCFKAQTSQNIDPPRMNEEERPNSVAASEATTQLAKGSKPLTPALNDESPMGADNGEKQMVKELSVDEYWDRLWIIQEVGRASRKVVRFGESVMEWNAFIELITLHNSHCQGPLRINRFLQERYVGSFSLRRLLQDHQTALCKERRDKIYGLVGLALDAFGFPMDYTKSLINVWKDTMEFLNRERLLPESDVIPFGWLVKSLLITSDLGPLQQVLQPYEPKPNSAHTTEDLNSPRVFKLRACIVGCIIAVGPSPVEITSSLHKADQWAAKIQQNFKPEEHGAAHRENDLLLQTILEFDDERLALTCFSHVSNVCWEAPTNYGYDISNYKSTINHRKPNYFDSLQSENQKSPKGALIGVESLQLFLIENCYRGKTPWKMGIASSPAKPGDLVCWIHGVQRAIILRVTLPEMFCQVIGTALFTRDLKLDNKTGNEDCLSSFSHEEKMYLLLDSATIYVLLA